LEQLLVEQETPEIQEIGLEAMGWVDAVPTKNIQKSYVLGSMSEIWSIPSTRYIPVHTDFRFVLGSSLYA
jgi:stage V sporulation protein SpoVS